MMLSCLCFGLVWLGGIFVQKFFTHSRNIFLFSCAFGGVMYLIYFLPACQMRVTKGDSGFYCVLETSFDLWLTPFVCWFLLLLSVCLLPFPRVKVASDSTVISTVMTVILELLCNRSLPALAWHRQNWNVVYPYVHLSEPEVEDLATVSHFVAGVTEAAAEGRSGFQTC